MCGCMALWRTCQRCPLRDISLRPVNEIARWLWRYIQRNVWNCKFSAKYPAQYLYCECDMIQFTAIDNWDYWVLLKSSAKRTSGLSVLRWRSFSARRLSSQSVMRLGSKRRDEELKHGPSNAVSVRSRLLAHMAENAKSTRNILILTQTQTFIIYWHLNVKKTREIRSWVLGDALWLVRVTRTAVLVI